MRASDAHISNVGWMCVLDMSYKKMYFLCVCVCVCSVLVGDTLCVCVDYVVLRVVYVCVNLNDKERNESFFCFLVVCR